MLVVLHKWFANFPEELLTIALSVAAALLLWIAFFGEKYTRP